jgi:hypothetical protein
MNKNVTVLGAQHFWENLALFLDKVFELVVYLLSYGNRGFKPLYYGVVGQTCHMG